MLAKKVFTLIAASLLWASSPLAQAFTYTDTDLLLVFRKDSYPDVEINLGSVSNFLGKARGTVITVTNWNLSLVTSNFDGSLADVKFILAAVAADNSIPLHAWLTDGQNTSTPTDVSGSRMSVIWSKVNNVGNQAQIFTATNHSSVYAIDSTDTSSYTYLVSEGGRYDVSTMGGGTLFPVESNIPATNRFFQLKVSNLLTKPAAVQIGLFSIDENGLLKFTAGQPSILIPPTDVVIARSGTGTVSVSFSTLAGAKYRLVSSSVMSDNLTWTALSTTVDGDGSTKTLQDSSPDAQRFYRVEVFQ